MPFFAGQNRDQMRRMYLEAWRKFSAREPLQPLEAQLAAVIAEHPEYVAWLEAGEGAVGAEFTPEGGQSNPFLHMGLHLAIREQVATNRPAGITEVHQKLAARLGAHEAEHSMLEPLAETLWEAQRQGSMPDEQVYLERLRKLAG
jgi:hypothetical protein